MKGRTRERNEKEEEKKVRMDETRHSGGGKGNRLQGACHIYPATSILPHPGLMGMDGARRKRGLNEIAAA